MLVVADVEASSLWYQTVLGLTSGHALEFSLRDPDGYPITVSQQSG
jgi:catechol 2,3-dioxygenase-like lactoylglutathione lyase family enzyme